MNSKKSLIFIVEDDIPCGNLILYYLKSNGFRNAVLFTTTDACLESLHRKPGILITDYRLKGMNGLHLIRKAKNIHSALYCILLSGMDLEFIISKEDARVCIDKYIMKGCSGMDELLFTLNNWLHNRYVEQYIS